MEDRKMEDRKMEDRNDLPVDGGGMLDSVTSLVGRAASAAASMKVPKFATAAPASLSAIANTADSGETASALADVAMVGKMSVAALSATGVGLPIAGALGVVMLVAYTVNKMIKENAKLQGVLADVLSIISNCYTIDRLIDRTLGVCTIALFGTDGDISKLLGILQPSVGNGSSGPAAGESEPSPASGGAGNANEDMFTKTYDALLVIAYKAKIAAYTTVPIQLPLMKLVAPNKDLKGRLLNKLGTLTDSLLRIIPDNILAALLTEATASGFGAIVKLEKARRDSHYIKSTGRIYRGMVRMSSALELQRELIKELTVVEGLFMLVKAQFDATMSYYSVHMKNWPDVRTVVENTAEFHDYLVPTDMAKVVENIKDDTKLLEDAAQKAAATIAQGDIVAANEAIKEAKINSDVNGQKNDTPTGGSRTRRRQARYNAIRGNHPHYARRISY